MRTRTTFHGDLANLKLLPNGLEIRLTREGRAYLKTQLDTPEPESKFHNWQRPHAGILWDLLEHFACNEDFTIAHGEHYAQLGALTDAPIILYGAELDDQNNLIDPGRVFWFPEYEVTSELDSLYNNWRVTFTEAQ